MNYLRGSRKGHTRASTTQSVFIMFSTSIILNWKFGFVWKYWKFKIKLAKIREWNPKSRFFWDPPWKVVGFNTPLSPSILIELKTTSNGHVCVFYILPQNDHDLPIFAFCICTKIIPIRFYTIGLFYLFITFS